MTVQFIDPDPTTLERVRQAAHEYEEMQQTASPVRVNATGKYADFDLYERHGSGKRVALGIAIVKGTPQYEGLVMLTSEAGEIAFDMFCDLAERYVGEPAYEALVSLGFDLFDERCVGEGGREVPS